MISFVVCAKHVCIVTLSSVESYFIGSARLKIIIEYHPMQNGVASLISWWKNGCVMLFHFLFHFSIIYHYCPSIISPHDEHWLLQPKTSKLDIYII